LRKDGPGRRAKRERHQHLKNGSKHYRTISGPLRSGYAGWVGQFKDNSPAESHKTT
jgi:hypothetical protein